MLWAVTEACNEARNRQKSDFDKTRSIPSGPLAFPLSRHTAFRVLPGTPPPEHGRHSYYA
jgi:hypothetical protein